MLDVVTRRNFGRGHHIFKARFELRSVKVWGSEAVMWG